MVSISYMEHFTGLIKIKQKYLNAVIPIFTIRKHVFNRRNFFLQPQKSKTRYQQCCAYHFNWTLFQIVSVINMYTCVTVNHHCYVRYLCILIMLSIYVLYTYCVWTCISTYIFTCLMYYSL